VGRGGVYIWGLPLNARPKLLFRRQVFLEVNGVAIEGLDGVGRSEARKLAVASDAKPLPFYAFLGLIISPLWA
jgi:hypothetical protein